MRHGRMDARRHTLAPLRRAKLDPELVRIVKAASLVEHNGGAYAHHLCLVFADDPDFQETARRWGEEETAARRGAGALGGAGRPGLRFRRRVRPFPGGFSGRFRQRPLAPRLALRRDGGALRRRDRHQLLLQRVRDAAEEPVLREICRHIAADELRHYRLFYKNLDRYLVHERLGRLGQAAGRARPGCRVGRRRTGLRLLRRQRGRPPV